MNAQPPAGGIARGVGAPERATCTGVRHICRELEERHTLDHVNVLDAKGLGGAQDARRIEGIRDILEAEVEARSPLVLRVDLAAHALLLLEGARASTTRRQSLGDVSSSASEAAGSWSGMTFAAAARADRGRRSRYHAAASRGMDGR